MNFEESQKKTTKVTLLKSRFSGKDENIVPQYRLEDWSKQDIEELVEDLDIQNKFERNTYE